MYEAIATKRKFGMKLKHFSGNVSVWKRQDWFVESGHMTKETFFVLFFAVRTAKHVVWLRFKI